MKKPLKITLISLGSLLGLILLVAVIACWIVLTPSRLTSIVQKQAPNFISCDFNIKQAELTIVKSFPKIGLKIDDVTLLNAKKNSPSDTLAYIHQCAVSVDIKKFLKENHIVIDYCRLNGGNINIFVSEDGSNNIDIFPASGPDTIEESSGLSYEIDLTTLRFNDISLNYTDISQGLSADMEGLNITAKGNMKDNSIAGDLMMSLKNLSYQQKTDSLSMAIKLNDFNIEGDATMFADDITADIAVSSSYLLFENEGQTAELNSFEAKYEGCVKGYDAVKGNAELNINDMTFLIDSEKLVDRADIRMIAPVDATLSTMNIELGSSQVAFNNIFIDLIGKVAAYENDDIVVDLRLNTNTLIVEELIELIPDSMREELLDGIDVAGELQIAADIEGTYNKSSMPVVNTEIEYNKGTLSIPEMLPYPITDLNTSIKAKLDLNKESDVLIRHFNADMSNSSIALSGSIKDIMDKMLCDIGLNANADLRELQPLIPDGIVAEGLVRLDLKAFVDGQQLSDMDFSKARLNGSMQCNDLDVTYYDTININADEMCINLTMPNFKSEEIANSLADLEISGNDIDAKVADMIKADFEKYNIKAQISNIFDENTPMSIYADYNFSRIDAALDEMEMFSNNPAGSVAMFMKENSEDASYIAVYSGDSLSFKMGEDINFVTERLGFNVSAEYDDDQEDLMLQWSPHAGIRLNNAIVAISDIPLPIYIPSIDFNYDSTGIEINNSSLTLGESDFELKGKFTNVDEFIRNEALLHGKLDFTSDYTDVNQIMALFSGMGDTTVVEDEIAITDTIADVKEDNPFIVPLGIDITLNTRVKEAIAGDMKLFNIGGGLTVKNGILVLQEMGFTSDAATMKVTAMYKSSRRNHLYLGLDLHLLEIDIAEMINLIPELDTLVPMLSSFAGNAEFHFAAETYLKSNYDLKMSTLKGATAIHGKDLVILDNETYKKIGRMLGFKDKEHNKIDHLNVEITAFKNEIDVYPTLVTVDKYQAVIAGRHNLNMNFNYKLGLSNPWLFRIFGVNIIGNPDDMKFKVRFKNNMDIENPTGKEKDVHLIEESNRLKNLIYESIK